MASTKTTVAKQPWELLDDDLEQRASAIDLDEAEKIDEAVGLQMISIRLERALLSNLKLIAKHHGVGYQPLIRDLLNRFARSELRNILHELESKRKEIVELAEKEAAKNCQTPMEPIDNFLERERKRA